MKKITLSFLIMFHLFNLSSLYGQDVISNLNLTDEMRFAVNNGIYEDEPIGGVH